MKCKVFGVQDVDFVNPNNGSQVKGKSIYCGFKNRYVDGLKTNKFFISSSDPICEDIVPDIEINMEFDDKGKLQDIEIY